MFYLGIRVVENGIQVVLLEKNTSGLDVSFLRTLPKDVNPLYILKPLLGNRECTVVSGLSGKDVLMKNLTFSLKSHRAVRKALPFQYEGLLPYPVEDAVLSPQLFQKGEETEVSLFATKKTAVSAHLKELAKDKVEPDHISSVPQALFRFARHSYPALVSLLVLHLEKDSLLLLCIRNGKLLASFSKPFGVGFLNAEPTRGVNDMDRLFASMQKMAPEVTDLLLTGELLPEGSSWIPPRLFAVEPESPFFTQYAIPFGLALDAARTDRPSVQFLQSHPPSKVTVARRKAVKAGYLAASVCFSLTTLFMGGSLIKKRERMVLKELSIQEKSFASAIKQLEGELKAQRTLKLSHTPSISKLLGWLSTHPAMAEGCSLTSLKFQHVKGKGYKVHLDLFIENPTQAEKVRRALSANRSVIQRQKGFQWSHDHSNYNATFYLRGDL